MMGGGSGPVRFFSSPGSWCYRLSQLPIDLRIAGGYAVVVNLIAYWAYARDKARARAGEWRISEATLHWWELIGGWPAAFLAQRRLRHKCVKRSYQAVFWLIVLGYQYAALDFLNDWRIARSLANTLQ